MRMLLKVQMSTERGNQLVKQGKLGATIQSILAEIKPEAAYFIAEGGDRTGLIIVDLAQPADIPRIAEPFFLALDAKLEIKPAMVSDDLAKAEPGFAAAVAKYGH